MSAGQEAVAQQISTEDLFGLVIDDQLGTLPEQPEAAAETPQDAVSETDTFEIDPELPEDLAAFLAQDDEPVAPQAEEDAFTFQDTGEEEFEYDEEKAALKKKLQKLEAKAAWAEEQRVKAVRPKWEAEAEKFFPFADSTSIQADSRRGFLKEAQAQHERNKQIFGTRGQKAAEAVVAAAQAEAEQIKANAKAEAEKAWGNPGVNLSPQAPGSKFNHDQFDEDYRKGGLSKAIRGTFNQGGE